MVCSRQAHVLARSCSLIAVTMLASVMTAETSATTGASASPGQKGIRKHVVHHHTISPLPPESPPLPVPIPRMTMDELPTQTPRVTYSTVVLTLDSENTTITEALSAIRDTTSLQIESLPESSERFAAHFSGTPREVIAHLLEGSEFGYVLLASRDDPAKLAKLILTKLASITPQDATKAGSANSPRPVPSRLAPNIPQDSNPPSADESTREATQTLPASLPPTAAFPVDTPPATAPPDGSAPANAVLTQPAGTDSRKQVNAASQYMQELYRMRLQQQSHQSGTPSATPPQ